jgi:hypothetical protein
MAHSAEFICRTREGFAYTPCESRKIILPLFHFNSNFMKSFARAMNKDGDEFLYLRHEFQRSDEAKIEEDIFIIIIFTNYDMFCLFRPLEEYFRPFSFEKFENIWILEDRVGNFSVAP